jgi:hypothetical protein
MSTDEQSSDNPLWLPITPDDVQVRDEEGNLTGALIFGWRGQTFPRLSLSVKYGVTYSAMRLADEGHRQLSIHCQEQHHFGAAWTPRAVPWRLVPELLTLIDEARNA